MKKKITKIILIGFVALCFFNTAYADTTIHLNIQTPSSSFYNQDITVAPCDSDNAGTLQITAYCAILQSGIASDWSWYGTDAFLNSLGGIVNDFTNNIYWGWFGDLTYGATALSAHILTPGEHLLLTYNINPLKLTVSNLSPTQNENITFTLLQFGLDSNFNPVWTPAIGGLIAINEDSHVVENDGVYSSPLELMVPYVISGNKTGFIDSNSLTLNPTRAISSGGGGGGAPVPSVASTIVESVAPSITPIPQAKASFDIAKAFDFIISQQQEDGSFGEDIYTDWTTLALASGNYQDQALKLVKYFGEEKISGTLLTDYERHAMALMALGLNPYDTNGINYIEKITSSFDGKQFGDANEDNDDIFALIVLQNAGFMQEEKMISDDINFILSQQKENGSWDESVDMTGASIEALAFLSQNEQVKNALMKAENFLKQNQKDDGGWGNTSSTAWALEGILALGDKPEDWIKDGNVPLDYLTSKQDTDGGIKNANIKNKIWETSYVLSVLSGKNWNQIMKKFKKPEMPAITAIPVEIKEKQEITKTEISENVNNIRKPEKLITQNLATPVIAIADVPVKEKILEPEPKKSWVRRFFDVIFGF
jgi:hypothetical protein